MTVAVLINGNPDSSLAALIIEVLKNNGIEPKAENRMPDALPLDTDLLLVNEATLRDAQQLRSLAEQAAVLVFSDDGSIRAAVRAIQQGARDYLVEPLRANEVLASIERALVSARQQAAASKDELAEFPMVGECTALQELRQKISKVARTNSPVLIEGESGTGKELIARALHAASPRKTQAMITVSCASIPENMIEGELFGHDDGLLEGASSARSRGLIFAADGGTLFLDEIGDLAPAAQSRLLRLLQSGELRALGSSEAIKVDVRVIAATHRDLQELANSGQFRADLYYRLNVLTLKAPPLRQRSGDAELIAQWSLQRTAKRLSRSVNRFSEDAIGAIRSYHWPGNVRELENAIERAVILADGDTIDRSLLAIEPSAEPADVAPSAPGVPDERTSLEDYFVQFVLENEDSLTETELAERLGISRKSLWERRQRLNIPRKRTRKRGTRQSQPS